MVMACKNHSGFDILLADVRGNDAESFYASVLIKTFFDRCRSQETDGSRFITALNRVLLEGSLKKQDIGALFIRVRHAERRIEFHPAGFPCQCLFGLGGDSPRAISLNGSALGSAVNASITRCELPYKRGDRLFIVSETESDRDATDEMPDPGVRVRESLLAEGYGTLDEMADGIWQGLRAEGRDHGNQDALLLGRLSPLRLKFLERGQSLRGSLEAVSNQRVDLLFEGASHECCGAAVRSRCARAHRQRDEQSNRPTQQEARFGLHAATANGVRP